jgi:ribosome-binding protein aMBF1 (putative translation factor)
MVAHSFLLLKMEDGKKEKNEEIEKELEKIIEIGGKERWKREMERKEFTTEREKFIEEVYPRSFTVDLIVG